MIQPIPTEQATLQQGLNNKVSPKAKTTQGSLYLGSNPGSKEAEIQPLSPAAAQEQTETTQKQHGCAGLRNRCHTPLLDLNCWDWVSNSELKYLGYDKVCGQIANGTIDSAPGVKRNVFTSIEGIQHVDSIADSIVKKRKRQQVSGPSQANVGVRLNVATTTIGVVVKHPHVAETVEDDFGKAIRAEKFPLEIGSGAWIRELR